MSTEIDQHVSIVTLQGEVLELDAPTDRLAEYMADVREFESRLKEAKASVNRELLRRMDAQAKWTEYAGGMKLTAPSPAPTEEFDGPELREALLDLKDQGVIAIEAVDAAVEVVVSYKPRAAGIKALRKLGGPVADAIDAHRTEIDKPRYVRVSRAG